MIRGWHLKQDPATIQKLRTDFRIMHAEARRLYDYDPVYPILKETNRLLGYGQEELATATLYHAAWYHLGTTLRVWGKYPTLEDLPTSGDAFTDLIDMPKTSGRRVFNETIYLRQHLRALKKISDIGAYEWYSRDLSPNKFQAWDQLSRRAETLPGNGRYFGYKIAELGQKILDLPVAAPDAGHKHSSGPRKGLKHLFPSLPSGNTSFTIAVLDACTSDLARTVREKDIAILETTLCAFSTFLGKGDYIGRYIDRTFEEVWKYRDQIRPQFFDAFIEARRILFPPEALVENRGETGIDRERLKAYRDYGILLKVGDPWPRS